MSGEELVRAWKDPDERGDIPHPAGEISLAAINGGAAAWISGYAGETVLGGNSCFLCIPDPPFQVLS
jgi:hypothetical protein